MRIALFNFFFISICIGYSNVKAQTPFVIAADLEVGSLLPHARIIKSGDALTAQQALSLFESGRGDSVTKSTLGYVDQYVWLYTLVRNGTPRAVETYLELNSPQIDYVHAFEVIDGEPISQGETGDQFSFYERPIHHRNFIYPLRFHDNEIKTFLLLFEKRGSSMDIPLFLWSPQALAARDYKFNLGYGVFFGFLFICLIFAALTFISLKQKVYLWYSLYILALIVYISSNLGLAFQFLYPWAVDTNSLVHVSFSVIIFILFFKFSQEFLPFRISVPRINTVLNVICYYFMVSIIIGIFTYPDIKSITIYFLPVNFAILLAGHILLVGTAFYLVRKHNRDASIFLVAIFSMFILGSLQVLRGYGVAVFTSTDLNLVMVGAFLEVFVFSLALTVRIIKINEERNSLSLKMAQQQKELLKAYVEGVEKERERISRELHDDIGSRLSNLKRFVSNESNNTPLFNQVDILCEDVRTMSHQLSPTSLKIAGLRQMILDLAMETHRDTQVQINVQFYDFPDSLHEDVSHHLYRIVQESVSNVVKHARATELDIQFFNHQNELVITLDDNGKGFDTEKASKGIGLKNMKARVESLNGTFDLSSNPGQGTSILIKGIFI